MKKILTTIFILIIGLTLVSCNRTEDKTLAKVYYYEFRNSFTTNKYNPDVVKSETFEVGKLISVPNEPFRPGHDFDGWYKDITYQEEWDFENDTLDKNIVLYAKWTNPTYKVNLNFNGGWFPSNTRYDGVYDEETIDKWLMTFIRRFFSQQFKRSCLPDGPKVGTITLSPRSDWRMPSDAVSSLWQDI